MSISHVFAKMAEAVAHASGRPITFALAAALIVVWAASGPLFGYSDTWQLLINTSTTIATFLMVFLIQNTQNRDSTAIHTKLDELIRVGESRNRLIGLEHLDEEGICRVRDEIERLRRAPRKRRSGKRRLPRRSR